MDKEHNCDADDALGRIFAKPGEEYNARELARELSRARKLLDAAVSVISTPEVPDETRRRLTYEIRRFLHLDAVIFLCDAAIHILKAGYDEATEKAATDLLDKAVRKVGGDLLADEAICSECGQERPGDIRVKAGLSCTFCAYGTNLYV